MRVNETFDIIGLSNPTNATISEQQARLQLLMMKVRQHLRLQM